jgi:Na+/H+-dicarboxylate symporter
VSLTTRVLIGLVAGILAGLAISAWPSPFLNGVAAVVAPVGTLWLNAIRMTVIPLVVASLVVGVTNAPSLTVVGRLGRRALAVFMIILTLSATVSIVVARVMLEFLHIDPVAAAALRAQAGSAATTVAKAPRWSQWLTDLIPTNPVKAAADGALLPLIIFTLAFGIALLSVDERRRAPVVAFFSGVFDAMLVLVRWILALAPIGVFALALPLAATLGLAAAGALGYYIGLVSLLAVVVCALILYPAAALFGHTPLRRFARAAAPAQAVAFSARSSLAAIPAMIEGARTGLGVPAEVSNFFIPLAAAVFRAGAGVAGTTGTLFLAHLYGITLTPAQMVTVAVTVVLTSFSVPGIPGGSIVIMLPALLAAGVPDAGIGLLLGVDTIPDMFRTATNVTGDLAAATIVARGAVAETDEDATPAEPLRA